MGGRAFPITSLSVLELFVVCALTARPGKTMNKANIIYCRRFEIGFAFIFLYPFPVELIKDKHGLDRRQWLINTMTNLEQTSEYRSVSVNQWICWSCCEAFLCLGPPGSRKFWRFLARPLSFPFFKNPNDFVF